jgi:hypothetical protein
MKKIIILLLMATAVSCIPLPAQLSPYKLTKPEPRMSEAAKVIISYSASIILNAVGDGLYDKGITDGGNYKNWGKICRVGSIGILLTSPLYIQYDKSKWVTYLLSYASLRISLFDPTYNLTRGLPITYIGNTSLWDKGLQKLAPPDGFMWGRGLSLILGISLPINELDDYRTKHHRKNKVF